MLSFKLNPNSVSNMALTVSAILGVFQFQIPIKLEFLRVTFYLGGFNTPVIVFMSIVPFVARYIKITNMKVLKEIMLSISIGLITINWIFSYSHSHIIPNILFAMHYKSYAVISAKLIAILIAIELLSRFVWWKNNYRQF